MTYAPPLCFTLAIACVVLASDDVVSQSPANQPNVLVYLSDDHSQADSSLYGNPNIPTPHFEQLAASGMTFTHAFVASPSCAPSRSAMLTGLMPARNGAQANHTLPTPGTPSLVKDLQIAGYEVVAFGKVAHGNRDAWVGFDLVEPNASVDNLRTNVAKFLAKRVSTQPLCLFVGTSNPHVAWDSPTTFDPSNIDLPPHHLDTPATRAHRAAYYQEIKELDALLGDLRQLSDQHLGKNAIFIHTSDHGGQWPFGKWTLYDYGIRVPLIVAWPGMIKAGTRTDAMVSWVDLMPTLIDIAGGSPPPDIDGRSFLKVLTSEQARHRDLIFTTHTGDGIMNIYPSRSVRDRQWKLIHNLYPEFAFTNHSDLDRKENAGAYWAEWAELANRDSEAKKTLNRYYQRPEFELFDLNDDPWELNNLAADPSYADKLAELNQMLLDWMAKQGDTSLVHHQPRLLSDRSTWAPESFPNSTFREEKAPTKGPIQRRRELTK